MEGWLGPTLLVVINQEGKLTSQGKKLSRTVHIEAKRGFEQWDPRGQQEVELMVQRETCGPTHLVGLVSSPSQKRGRGRHQRQFHFSSFMPLRGR